MKRHLPQSLIRPYEENGKGGNQYRSHQKSHSRTYVVPAGDDKAIIELKAGDGVVVCAKTVNGLICRQVKNDTTTV